MTDPSTLHAPTNRRGAGIDPQITYTVLGAALAFLTWLAKQFWQSAKEARQGRKDEAQRIAADRDHWKRKAESYYNRKQRFKDVLWATRQVAMQKGNLAPEDLPEVPPDN